MTNKAIPVCNGNDELSYAAACHQRLAIMKAIQTPLVLSLLLTLAAGTLSAAQTEDSAPNPKPVVKAPVPPPAPKKPIHQMLTGKVIFVDKYNRTVTLQVNNLTYVLQITDSTRLNRSGKDQTMADFIVGEEVTVNVILRELPNGRVEVAVVNVDLPDAVVAQGTNSPGRYAQPPPFQNGPNPANIDGPVISRH